MRVPFGAGSRRKVAIQTARSLIRELPNFFKLVFRLLRDPALPRVDRILFGVVAAYMLLPTDLLPDFLGFMGWVDDLYLLALALGRLLGSAGPERLLRHWDGDPANLGYLIEGVEELGGLLPAGVRKKLGRLSRASGRRPRRRRPRPPQADDEARIHVVE